MAALFYSLAREPRAAEEQSAASSQNTGAMPSRRGQRAGGERDKVWLPFSSEVRMPTASPWRPGGEAS